MGTARVRAAAAVAVIAVAAAACGGDDGDGGEASGNILDQGAGSALAGREVGAGGSGTTVAVDHPETMEEWEELWATERAAIVAEIQENGWGLQADGTTVTGADGFTIDLAACQAGWSNTEGLTDTSIKWGATGPLSGAAADGGNINRGIGAVLAHYGEEGAFTDAEGKTRTVDYLIRDDGYDATRTIPLVDELLDSERVFAIHSQGSPHVIRNYDKINQRCVPNIFNIGGHPAWGDPVNHPWTTGHQITYNVEALLWGTFIDQRIDEFGDGPVVITALALDNEAGKIYSNGFQEYLRNSPNADRFEYHVEFIDPQAPSATDQMTTLASKNPDVFLEMLTGTPCSYAITEAARNGMKEGTPYKFVSSVCNNATYVGPDAVGDATEGWWMVGGGFRDLTSQAEDGNPFVEWGRDLQREAGIETSSGFAGWGIIKGWALSQIIQVAGELEGGLTRANLITAARHMEMTNPGLAEGMTWNTSGNTDAYFVEGSEVAQYDTETHSWVRQGDVIDLSGQTSPCAWDQATSSCG